MFRQAALSLIGIACLLLSGGLPAAGQPAGPVRQEYHIKPSEVVIPEGVALGQYRRVITPFENWTLVCDEDLQAGQMVCNASQVIVDSSGILVLSWSLAATMDGEPYMILRTAPQADPDGRITLSFADISIPLEVEIDGCNDTVCVGVMPVGPIMNGQIRAATEPVITFPTTAGERITVTTSLKGLTQALSVIE